MTARTIDDVYLYRIYRVLKQFKIEFDTDVSSGFITGSFEDYLHYRRADFGISIINNINEYCGIDDALQIGESALNGLFNFDANIK